MPGQLLLLSAIAILSHPLLDTLNTYGVRWLMPFSGRWFYGDTLFIVDPWLWLALAAGVVLSRPRRAAPAARVALWRLGSPTWRPWRHRPWRPDEIAGGGDGRDHGRAGRTGCMVSPFPVNPFRRGVVVEQEEVYRTARFRLAGRAPSGPGIGAGLPQGAGATIPPSWPRPERRWGGDSSAGRVFRPFSWSRPAAGQFVVHIIDLRYADRPGVRFGSVSIPVTVARSAPAAPQSDLTE